MFCSIAIHLREVTNHHPNIELICRRQQPSMLSMVIKWSNLYKMLCDRLCSKVVQKLTTKNIYKLIKSYCVTALPIQCHYTSLFMLATTRWMFRSTRWNDWNVHWCFRLKQQSRCISNKNKRLDWVRDGSHYAGRWVCTFTTFDLIPVKSIQHQSLWKHAYSNI